MKILWKQGTHQRNENSRRPPVWEIAVHLAVACDACIDVSLCCPFLPRDVFDEIRDLIANGLIMRLCTLLLSLKRLSDSRKGKTLLSLLHVAQKGFLLKVILVVAFYFNYPCLLLLSTLYPPCHSTVSPI